MAGTLCSEFESKEQGIQEKATLLKGVSTKQRKAAFDLFTNRGLLVWLKGLALDPCNMVSSQHSIQMLQQELLKFRKSSMVCDLKYPKRERNLKHILNDGKSSSPFGLTREISHNKNDMKMKRGQSSFISCSLHFKGKGNSFQVKQRKIAFHDTSNCNLLKQDSVEFAKELNQLEQKHLVICSDYTRTTKKLSGQEKPKMEHIKELGSLLILKDPMKTSKSSTGSKKEGKRLELVQKFLYGGNSHRRPVIPIGPRFQAEVPNWEGPTIKRFKDNVSDLWFLGIH